MAVLPPRTGPPLWGRRTRSVLRRPFRSALRRSPAPPPPHPTRFAADGASSHWEATRRPTGGARAEGRQHTFSAVVGAYCDHDELLKRRVRRTGPRPPAASLWNQRQGGRRAPPLRVRPTLRNGRSADSPRGRSPDGVPGRSEIPDCAQTQTRVDDDTTTASPCFSQK